MKQIVLHITFLLTIWTLNSQVVIKSTIKTNLIDNLSQENYTSTNTYNRLRKNVILTNIFKTYSIRDVISSQYNELTTIHWSLLNQSYKIKNFIKGTQFSSSLGYCSYGYIEEKYPIINPLSPSSVYKNTIIRMRFYKKFTNESERIDSYLNSDNPIPEGERLLLILTSLENVINITLENETY
jgi:hypothetical protein